jgi:hypothetical protein
MLADFTATETREAEPSMSREVTSKAAAAASRDRTPLGGSPNKTAAAPQSAAAAYPDLAGAMPDGGNKGVQMQELKKSM